MADRFTIVPLLQSPDKPDYRVKKQCPKENKTDWQPHKKPCKHVHTPDPETQIKRLILAAAKLPQLQKSETGPTSDDEFFLSIGEVEADYPRLRTDLSKYDPNDKFVFRQAVDPTALYARIRVFVAGKVANSAETKEVFTEAIGEFTAWNAKMEATNTFAHYIPSVFQRLCNLAYELKLALEWDQVPSDAASTRVRRDLVPFW